MKNVTYDEKGEFKMTPFQESLVKRVIECIDECKTNDTKIMFAKKGDYHEYDGREFSNRDYGDEWEDEYIWVCFNGYKDGEDMQEMGWGDEITFEDFKEGNYVVPKLLQDFDSIAVKNLEWHINERDVYCTCSDEPGGVDTDMYYFV